MNNDFKEAYDLLERCRKFLKQISCVSFVEIEGLDRGVITEERLRKLYEDVDEFTMKHVERPM